MKQYAARICSLALSLLLLFSLTGCWQYSAQAEQQKFDNFLQSEFIEAMESDYTTAHVYLQNPGDFGVDTGKIEVGLGDRMTEENLASSKEAFQESYQEFQSINRELLTAQQKDYYDIYAFQASLIDRQNDEKFDYYANLFESMSGLHYQLPSLLADWQLRNEQDVKDLVLLLNDVQPYMESALDYTRRQQELGLLMLDLDSIIEYCQTIVDSGENSSILRSMNQSIEALQLGDAKMQEYEAQVKEAFLHSFLPAYQNIIDTMESFRSGPNNEEGLAHFEHGAEYYTLLLQESIGSNKSVEDIQAMMEEEYNRHLMQMQTIMLENMDVLTPLLTNDLPETGFTSYTAMLDSIREQMGADFPAVSDLSYNIQDINEEIASSSGIAAYFNIPPLDGDSVKQLRVNPLGADLSSISTYSTVAHEGFPGHMYQYAFMYENIGSDYIKALANIPAYTEGYAVYAQYESFRYLEGIDAALLEAYKENELASYCAIILADIGIHYEGWGLQEFSDFLTEMGFLLSEEDAKLQYAQLQANPAAFQPYYVGYHEIANLKEAAQEELGSSFSEKEFNLALLSSGTANFEVVQRHIAAYVQHAAA